MLEKIRQFFAALLGEEVKAQPIVVAEPEAPAPKPKKKAAAPKSKKKRSPSKKAK